MTTDGPKKEITVAKVSTLGEFKKRRAEAKKVKVDMAKDVTRLEATCVCGKPIQLILTKPQYDRIEWSAYCRNCSRYVAMAIKG